MKFTRYDKDELERCGQAFVANLTDAGTTMTARILDRDSRFWTDMVLNWFAAAAAEWVTVDTSMATYSDIATRAPSLPEQFTKDRRGYGETLRVDQIHWQWPAYSERLPYWTKEYWRTALSSDNKLECLLALECEWAGKTNEAHYCEVMHEAAKLATVAAQTKVIVFASHHTQFWQELTGDIEKLRRKVGDDKPWLLVDVPWGSWTSSLKPQFKVTPAGS